MGGPKWWWRVDSPVGGLRLLAGTNGLREISFERRGGEPRRSGGRSFEARPSGPLKSGHRPKPGLPEEATRYEKPFVEVIRQLDAYFAGELEKFDLALAPEGTPFQLDVWRLLGKIPYGETTSYGELARRLRRPEAARAVGAANGSNPIPIVIPCHRVVGSNGSLTGFGGGLEAKRWLLRHESSRNRLWGQI